MSTVDADVETPGAPLQESDPPGGHTELTIARLARVGDVEVRRLLPLRRRRSVGAWCFVDHYGPMSVDGVAGMQVPPHPHIGLQTVTWLLEGNVLHRDSLGSEQMIRPGQLNLMTAGHGIAHSEESPDDHDPGLHGVQLWLALPDADRQAAPAFEHHAQLPVLGAGGAEITVFAGSLADVTSPARTYSPLVGAEINAVSGGDITVPLARGHEHVIFVARGPAGREREHAHPGQPAVPGDRARLAHPHRERGRPAVPARRRAARRDPADVVELRRPDPGGHHRRGSGLDGGQRALRGGPGLPGGAPARSPARPGPPGPPLPRLLSRHPPLPGS
jgi:redox-sensitive bicupin YhaK (pirin superfamily)